MALHELLQDERYSVEYLLTSVNAVQDRVTMHGLRSELLEKQLESIGITSGKVLLPEHASNADYEKLMSGKVSELESQGFAHAAFGDIFLEDLKVYRENQLATFSLQAVFPIWKRDTRELMKHFVESGFKAIVICADASKLDESWVGRVIDRDFVDSLPENVDACGENGEFHTFCFDAPFFKKPIDFTVGETVYREYESESYKSGFWFCDLLPK